MTEGHAKVMVGTAVFEVITPYKPGTKVALFIRPEEVTIALKDGDLPKTSVRNQLQGTITKMVPFGPFVRTTIDFGSNLTALVTRRSADELCARCRHDRNRRHQSHSHPCYC